MERFGLISSEDRTLYVALPANDLGSGKISLSFGPRGNVVAVEQRTDAGLAQATSTLAGALTAARQEFVAGLGSVQQGQASVLAIQSAGRNARVQELKDRSTLLDAQIAFDGATASRDLVEQKRQVDAELALLNAQQSLSAATGTAETSSEMAALRSEIEALRLQLDLIRLQQELAAARGGANPQN